MRSPSVSFGSRVLLSPFALLIAVFLGSCADAPSVLDFSGEDRDISLSLNAQISPATTSEEGAAINRIRMIARVVGTGEVVGQTIEDVSSGESAWTLDISVSVPAGANPQVVVTIELINVSGGVESVVWSGETAPIGIAPGATPQVPSVELVRGPPGNLKVTGITIQGAPDEIRREKTAQLNASVETSESGTNLEVFWASDDPEIGTITDQGLFLAVAPGSVDVTASAGIHSHTVTIQVLPALLGVTLEPSTAALSSFGDEVTFTATVLDETEAEAAGEGVDWSVTPEGILEDQGSGVFQAVGEGTATVTATSSSESGLSATAEVTVLWMADLIDISPEAVTLENIGETVQFSAEVFDANDNEIEEPELLWTSSNPNVATIDEDGLATSVGGGYTEIQAEFVATGATEGSGVFGIATLSVEGYGSLAGRVVDAGTGTPIAGVSVTVSAAATSSRGAFGSPPSLVSTDAEGRWELNDIEPGPVNLTVEGAGRVGTTYHGATVTPNSTTVIETVPLAPSSSSLGNMEGTVINAVNGSVIPGATVSIRPGMNNTEGTPLATETTGSYGEFWLSHLPAGTYTLTASAGGFTSGRRTGYIIGGSSVYYQDLVLSPTGAQTGDHLRVVLTWGVSPSDLDSHIWGPSSVGTFHVYFGNHGSLTESPFAALDLDDTSSYGPETITAILQEGGPYTYGVHDWSNSGATSSVALGNSGARVAVYQGTVLIGEFFVPAGQGTFWEVFTFENGVLTPVNVLSNTSPSFFEPVPTRATVVKGQPSDPGGGEP